MNTQMKLLSILALPRESLDMVLFLINQNLLHIHFNHEIVLVKLVSIEMNIVKAIFHCTVVITIGFYLSPSYLRY